MNNSHEVKQTRGGGEETQRYYISYTWYSLVGCGIAQVKARRKVILRGIFQNLVCVNHRLVQ